VSLPSSTAVIFMAYGSPHTLDDLEAYYTDIRRGRAPSPEQLEDLAARYRRIGGASPLNDITLRQARAVGERLPAVGGRQVPVFVGMKHWRPSIDTTVGEIVDAGVQTLVGIVLAPHFSNMSIGGYERQILAARDARGAGFELRMVPQWYDEPGFVRFTARRLGETLGDWDRGPQTRVFFTAHSLPARILAEGDPYRDQLTESSKLIAEAAGGVHWELAFQSASATGEPWLGPDVVERLEAFAAEGGQQAVVAPIGFTADHLEVLYDVDVECVEAAERLGLELRRLPSPNDEPEFADVLAGIVVRALK
jgi:protoporphyrin/coproporphyrin ferrochelatase